MRIAASLLIALALASGCTPKMTDARRELHVASFDQVWETVRDQHYDPKLNGVDWDAVRAELRPKIAQARTDDDVRDILNEMLSRLELSHFAIYPPDMQVQATPKDGFVPPLAKDSVIEVVKFGNLPELPLRVHSQRLNSNVQYFYVSVFINPLKVLKLFRQSVEDARTADGFILDLRHNPGGIGGMAIGMGNAFVTRPNQTLGQMRQRDITFTFALDRQANPYEKPLAILIDQGSASTSEILAAGLKDIGRARIFGSRSAGMALPSLAQKLPNGDNFQYAVANYISSGGATLEGVGVTPDQVVEYKPPYNLPDPVVEAAAAWIKSQSETKR